MKLAGKVAIITGAGQGIGRAIAVQFAKNGASTVLVGRRPEPLQQVADEISKNFNQKSICLTCDVSDVKQVDEVIKKTLDTLGRIDILVNNAGVTRDQLLALMTESDWDSVLSTNLKGCFLFTKAVSRQMIRQRWGRVINMSSVIGVMGNAGQANYAASKGGIIAFTKSVARELAKRSITVNAIAPGFIDTAMTAELKEEAKKELLNQIPLGRFGVPDDVAHSAVFLASDEAGYITGQVLQVCGGMLT